MSELDQPINSLEGMSLLEAEMTKRGMETRLIHDLEAALGTRCDLKNPAVVKVIINGIIAKQGCIPVVGVRQLFYWAGYYHAYLLQQNVNDYNHVHIVQLYNAIGNETNLTGFIKACELVDLSDSETVLFEAHQTTVQTTELVTYLHQALISGIPLRKDYIYRTYTRTIMHGINYLRNPISAGTIKRLVRFIDRQYEISIGNHNEEYRRGHLNAVVAQCAKEDEPLYYYMVLIVFCVLEGELRGFNDPSDEADLIRVAGYVARRAHERLQGGAEPKDFDELKELFLEEYRERFAMNIMRFVQDL